MHPSDAGQILAQLRHGRSLSDESAELRPAGLCRLIIGTAIAKGMAVPIIKKQESSKRAGAAAGAESSILVGVDQGSQSLHIEEVSVAPNARIPRRINPHTEVAIIVQEGKVDAILGRERVPIGSGDTVLAPAGSAHGFLNRYEEPARLLFVFPTHQVEQVEVSIPGATSGFPSEKGLSGYQSPEDRPLGEGR
jgi:quercetin dioxygenase-like cupin family protein